MSMILKQQAALGYPTFVVILELFRVLLESPAAILARSLTHRTHLVHQETFFENPSAQDEPTADVYARGLTATSGDSVSLNEGRSIARVDELERNTESF